MTFYAGQKVVCVDASCDPGCEWWDDERIREGEVYTIARLRSCPFDGTPIVDLVERLRDMAAALLGVPVGYGVSRFRPLVERKTSIEVFKKLLVTKHEKENA